ncbi:MAG: Ig-like domain-containing protein [Pirellulaceae bacterium]
MWFDQVANAIVQQRFDANSNPVTDVERLQSVRADRAVTSIQIQPHEDGAFSVLWTEQTARPTDPEVSSFLALFDQDGAPQSSVLEVGDSISTPAHWFDAGTSHIVLIRSERTETTSQLWLERYDADLRLVSQSFVTETSDIPFAHPLRISQTESGTFWLTYFDQTETGLSLFAIHLGADSLPIGITQLNDDTPVHPTFAQIHAATDDSVTVSWISDDPLLRGRQLQLRTAISTYTEFEYQYATDDSTTAFATLELSELPGLFAVADAVRTDQQTWEVPFHQYASIRLLGPADHRPIALRSSLKSADGAEVYAEQLVLGSHGNDLFVPPADLTNDPAFVRIEGGPGFDLLDLPFASGNASITTDAYGVRIIPNDSSLPTFLVSGSTDAIHFSDQQVTFDSLIQTISNLTTHEDERIVFDWVPGKFGESLAERITLDEPPSHGDLLLLADGGLAYQPDPDYAGEDSFSYRYQVPAIHAPVVDGVNQDIISGDLETWLPWLSLEQFSPGLVDGQEYAFQFRLVDLVTSDADLHVQLDSGTVLIADELTSPILESTPDNTLTFRFTKTPDVHAIHFAPLVFGPTPAASVSISGIKLLDVAAGSLILDKTTRPGPRHTVRMQILPVADSPLVSVQPITTREDEISSFSFVAKAIDLDGSESVQYPAIRTSHRCPAFRWFESI